MNQFTWCAQVRIDVSSKIWQCFFDSAEEAGKKVAEKRIQFFGEFSNEQKSVNSR